MESLIGSAVTTYRWHILDPVSEESLCKSAGELESHFRIFFTLYRRQGLPYDRAEMTTVQEQLGRLILAYQILEDLLSRHAVTLEG